MTPTKENKGHNLPLLIENWMTLNKTPFSDWKVCIQHKNILLICLEIFEEMEMVLRKDRKDHISVKMAFREIKDDIEILCTYQVQPAICVLFYTLVCQTNPEQELFSGKDRTLQFAVFCHEEEKCDMDNEIVEKCSQSALQYLQSVGYDVKYSGESSRKVISILMPENKMWGKASTSENEEGANVRTPRK